MRSGKEAQRKRVQKETNRDKRVCVRPSLRSTRRERRCRRTNRHPHARNKYTRTAKGDTHTPSSCRETVHVCIDTYVFVCERVNLSVSLPKCRLLAQNKPPLSLPGHREAGDVGWLVGRGKREKRKDEKTERGKENKGRLKEKDWTAVYCHLWGPAAVKSKEFVSPWWYYTGYCSSLPFHSVFLFHPLSHLRCIFILPRRVFLLFPSVFCHHFSCE